MLGQWLELLPSRGAAFASLKARPQPAPAPADPTDGIEGPEASGLRKPLLSDSRKTIARPARSS